MSDSERFRALSDYNRWINDHLYELCAGLPDADAIAQPSSDPSTGP